MQERELLLKKNSELSRSYIRTDLTTRGSSFFFFSSEGLGEVGVTPCSCNSFYASSQPYV